MTPQRERPSVRTRAEPDAPDKGASEKGASDKGAPIKGAPGKGAVDKKGSATKAETYRELMARPSWKPLPAVVVLVGTADFLKGRIVQRFAAELFGAAGPEIVKFQGPASEKELGELKLATVLDELRTPSFFSPHRLVVVEGANAFIAAYGEDIAPFIARGFAGGYLILAVDGKLDGRTRFARQVAEGGWIVECAQPYDRPPPWDSRSPPWDSELSRWVVAHARERGLEMDTETAFLLHERAGTDLAVLDEELEKIATYLSAKAAPGSTRRVDRGVIRAVVGDTHEDSVFAAVELFLEASLSDALSAVERMFDHGIQTDRGGPTFDPMSIALLFVGALIPRLRALRRAHALVSMGHGPDRWIEAGLVQRPFLLRFQRQMRAMPPARISRVLQKLYDVDKGIKSGAPPARMLELLVLETA